MQGEHRFGIGLWSSQVWQIASVIDYCSCKFLKSIVRVAHAMRHDTPSSESHCRFHQELFKLTRSLFVTPVTDPEDIINGFQ